MNSDDISGIEPLNDSSHQLTEPFYLHEAVMQSQKFPWIYFAKRNMKSLLQERSAVSASLKFNMNKNSKSPYNSAEISELLGDQIAQVFDECPSKIDSYSLITLEDCLGFYTFFSSDGKYVPMCKLCNCSVYLVTRKNVMRVVCCNSGCEKKIVGDSYLNLFQSRSSTKTKKSHSYIPSMKTKTIEEVSEAESKNLSQEHLARIKKVSHKILRQ